MLRPLKQSIVFRERGRRKINYQTREQAWSRNLDKALNSVQSDEYECSGDSKKIAVVKAANTRATLNFRKIKVALNPMYRIFLNFAKSCS